MNVCVYICVDVCGYVCVRMAPILTLPHLGKEWCWFPLKAAYVGEVTPKPKEVKEDNWFEAHRSDDKQ